MNGVCLHLLLLRSTGVLSLIAALTHCCCLLKMSCEINMQMIAVIFKVHIKKTLNPKWYLLILFIFSFYLLELLHV